MRIHSPVRPINWWSLFDSSSSVRKRGKSNQNFSVEHIAQSAKTPKKKLNVVS